MAEEEALVGCAAACEPGQAALAGLNAIRQVPKDQLIGQDDVAVTGQENGKPHVVKRVDRPHSRVIPEWFGGGRLARKELREAAEELTVGQAGSSRSASQPPEKDSTTRRQVQPESSSVR